MSVLCKSDKIKAKLRLELLANSDITLLNFAVRANLSYRRLEQMCWVLLRLDQ